MLRRAMDNTDTQDLSRPKLGGSHHLLPYNILCGWPRSPHPNGFLSQDSQVGVLKSPKSRLSQIWSPITLQADLRWKCNMKQSCNSHQELFNGMSHGLCRQINRVNSQLFVVGNQTTSLTPGLSFGHNLCFKCPNEQCEPILDIQVPKAFQ